MIWFDGQLVCEAQLDATSAGALMGAGVFTTLAVRAGAPVFWRHHAARLQRDAQAARVEMSFDAMRLREGLSQLLERENIRDGVARITGTRRGDGRWNGGEGAHWSIIARGAQKPASGPLRLQVSPFRVAARAPLAGVKTTSYLPYFIAWEEARARGFDEALLLTESDWICESARASVFWQCGDTLYTPSLDCGCLRGVGRAVVLEKWGAQQSRAPLSALWEADEAFVVSGAAGVRAIGAIYDGGRMRHWDEIGPVTTAIQRDFWGL